MSCCNHDCEQGDTCPRRRAENLAEAVAGYATVLCVCLAAACWLILLG